MHEKYRIDFLMRRDGEFETREWSRKAADLYATAISTPRHFASRQPYRGEFKNAVKEFMRFSHGK